MDMGASTGAASAALDDATPRPRQQYWRRGVCRHRRQRRRGMAPWQLVIVLAACLFSTGDRAALAWERTYYSSVRWLNHGEFERARTVAEAGYGAARGRPQSRAFWTCRLALAESLIELDRTNDALPLLQSAAPASEVEARRLSDLAMVQYRSGQYDRARQSTDAAARIGLADGRDTLAKIDLLRGMLQLKAGQM